MILTHQFEKLVILTAMNKYIAPLLLFCLLVFVLQQAIYASSYHSEGRIHHMSTSPKEATKLLNTIPNPEKLPEGDYLAWCLQYIRSLNKQDSLIKSDSLIRVAVNYYGGTSLHKHAGTSYYLLGCIYENKQETQLAMSEFKRAESEFLQIDAYNQLALVYYHFGFYIPKMNT